MKTLRFLFLLAAATIALSVNAQTQKLSNRYGMKLTDNGDGTYSLLNAKKYLPFAHVDVDTIPDVYNLYTYTPDRLQSRDYKGVRTEDIIFKKTDTYECKLTVDYAENVSAPAPFMIYIHGGGWQRGDNSSGKSLSQYLAKQRGVCGFRVEYVMSGVEGSNVEMSISDIIDAYKYICDNAEKFNIDPKRFGFLGTSAGAHLAGIAAMRVPGTKVLVGYSGIYDLTNAAICMKAKLDERIRYFFDKDVTKLRKASALYSIPKKNIPGAMLVCGTADATIECSQSIDFAAALKEAGADVKLLKYTNYDHNLSSKTSDKMEEIFFHSVDFICSKLGAKMQNDPAPAAKKSSAKPQAAVAAPAAPAKTNPAKAMSAADYSVSSAVTELRAMGIHDECPDSSGVHAACRTQHIVKVYDEQLGRDVYAFLIHSNIDDDRGKKNITDRQRNEVKTDSKSPLNLWAQEGETLTMRWKFCLPVGFQTTKKFSHIHQLKGMDNKSGTAEVGEPLITFTCYTKGNGKGQQLRLRYNDRSTGGKGESKTLAQVDLLPFLGQWVEVEETANFSQNNGSYSVVIKNVRTGAVMFQYEDNSIDMWRTDARGLRPKWGIYRYLGPDRSWADQLRDEEIRFADFEIIKK